MPCHNPCTPPHCRQHQRNGPGLVLLGFSDGTVLCSLQPAIRSRRFPYASIDRYVVEDAQLTQIKVVYSCTEELALRAPWRAAAGFSSPFCEDISFAYPSTNTDRCLDPSCVLLPPHHADRPATNQITTIAAALATRFDVSIGTVRPYLNTATVEEWGKLRRIDSDEGDTMWASSCCTIRDDARDATYVRVCDLYNISILPATKNKSSV